MRSLHIYTKGFCLKLADTQSQLIGKSLFFYPNQSRQYPSKKIKVSTFLIPETCLLSCDHFIYDKTVLQINRDKCSPTHTARTVKLLYGQAFDAILFHA